MPGLNPHPPVAFIGDFDARPWAGQSLFSRAGFARTMPSLANLPARYCDLMSFLNGRYTPKSLAGMLDAAVQASAYTLKASTVITAGIDRSDRVYIECNYPIRLNARADNVWLGFSTTVAQTATGTGPYRITAPSEWVRGHRLVATAGWSVTMDPSGASITCYASSGGWYQDVPTILREPATVDEDSTFAASCLQSFDSGHSWWLDDLGHVCSSWYGASAAINWTNQSFAKALGFTGQEVYSTYNVQYCMLRATHPCAAVLVPSRGLARLDRGQVEDCATKRYDDGSYAGVHHGSYERLFADLYLDGPADLRAPNGRDLERHFLRWLRANPTGSRVTFYQHWGDPRRALSTADVANGYAYSLTRTSEEDGRRGRVICYRAPGLEEWRASYEHTIRSGAPVTLVLDPEA